MLNHLVNWQANNEPTSTEQRRVFMRQTPGRTPKVVILITQALLFSACSPVYKTTFTYTPPETDAGKLCIAQCENNKIQCAQLEQMRYSSCQQQSDFDYHLCRSRRVYRYNHKGHRKCVSNCYCYHRNCYQKTTACESNYRLCYEACGGKIISETQCVERCDKINKN